MYKSFLKNNLWTLGGHLLLYAQGILLIPLIIKGVGVNVYGEYVLGITTLAFIFGISSFGVGYRYKRYTPAAPDRQARSRLFYPQFIFNLISIALIAAAIMLVAPLLRRSFPGGLGNFSFFMIPLYFLFMLFHSQGADYFRYTDRIIFFNLAAVIVPYLNIGLVKYLIYRGVNLNINTLVLTLTFVLMLVSVPLFTACIWELGLPSRLMIGFTDFFEDLRLGFPLLLNYLVDTVLSISDRFIIAAFLGVITVGYYSPAYALGTLIILFPKVSGVVLPPLLSNAVDNGKEREARLMVNYTIKGLYMIGIPFVIGSLILGKPLLTLLANPAVAGNAYFVTPFVALGTIFYGLNIILSNVLFLLKKTSVIFRVSLAAALVNVLLNVVLLYIFKNIVIAAITTLLSYVIAFINLSRIVSSFKWKVDYQINAIVRFFLASILMALILFGYRHIFPVQMNALWQLLTQVAMGFLAYAVGVFIFGGLSRKEIFQARSILIQ